MMKIKVYVDFDNERVMTETEHADRLKCQVDHAMEDSITVGDVLDSLCISNTALYFMDADERGELQQKVRNYLAENIDDDNSVREFELEV